MENLNITNAFFQATSYQPDINSKKIEEGAESFEAFFLTRMMESMFEGVSTDGIFGGGHAEKIYRSMLLDQYGKEMAKVGGVGVKDWVMRSILEMQEQNSVELLG